MEIKNIKSATFLCYTTQTTLNKLKDIAPVQVDNLFEQAEKAGLTQTGPLEFIYFDCSNDRDKVFTLEIALPVETDKSFKNEILSIKKLDDFKCLSHTHSGDLLNLPAIYKQLFEDLFKGGKQPTNQIREVYEKFESMESEENITEIQIGIN